MLKNTLLAFAVTVGTVGLTAPSFAAGGGGSTTSTPTCKKNLVWDKSKKKCVKIKKSNLDDDNIYESARDLAYHQRYEEAIELLNLASNKSDPRILNYLGYSNRKLGRVEKGLTYYQAALKVDPDYTLVMEYMGEAFLQLGQVDKAKAQLAAIELRCGTDCREYAMLDKQIKAYAKQ